MFLLLFFEQRFGKRLSRFVGHDSVSVGVNLHGDSEVNTVKIIYLVSGQDPQSINLRPFVWVKQYKISVEAAPNSSQNHKIKSQIFNKTSGQRYQAFLLFVSKIILHRFSEYFF